jgi:2-aminoadipate transaminase
MWNDSLNTSLHRLLGAPTSEVEERLQPPTLIRLSGGLPAEESLAADLLAEGGIEALASPLGAHRTAALQYGDTRGYRPLRELLASSFGISTNSVCVSSGSQSALDAVGRLILREGSRVGIIVPSYMGVFRAWAPLDVEFVSLSSHDSPVDLNLLAEELRRGLDAVYLVPHHSNPSGMTLSLTERAQIVELVECYNSIIVEDDAYRELGFSERPLTSLYEMAPDHVVHLRTFSKTVAPGLRLGWIAAPEAMTEGFAKLKLAIDCHASTLSQVMVLYTLQSPRFLGHLDALRALYAEKSGVMDEALHAYFSDVATWTAPRGGFFYFLNLTNGTDTRMLLEEAVARGVSFMPGSMFTPEKRPQSSLRLSFSSATKEEIWEGVRLLRESIDVLTGRGPKPSEQDSEYAP